MDRRTFLGIVAGTLLAAPLAAEAQPTGKVYQIGLVSLGHRPAQPGMFHFMLEALREQSYVEGRNLVVREAFLEGRADRLRSAIADIVQAKVDVIVTTSTPETEQRRTRPPRSRLS